MPKKKTGIPAAETLIFEYISHCKKKKLSENTLKSYQLDLNQYAAYLREMSYECGYKSAQQYIDSLQGHKIKSIKRKLSTLKMFLSYLCSKRIIPAGGILFNAHLDKSTASTDGSKETMDWEEVQRMLHTGRDGLTKFQEMDIQYREYVRDLVVLELIASTGMQCEEICGLRRSDVNFHDGTVRIKSGSGTERTVRIDSENVRNSLLNYYRLYAIEIEEAGCFIVNHWKEPISADSVRTIIRKFGEMARIPRRITPRMIRRAFTTMLLEKSDMDIRDIQLLVGHKEIASTKKYDERSRPRQLSVVLNEKY